MRRPFLFGKIDLRRRPVNRSLDRSSCSSGPGIAYPEELVTRLADGFEPDPGRSTMLYFQHSGGAIGRVASDATAFAHRKSMASTPMRCPMRRSESSTAIIRAITSACCRSRIATIRITCSGRRRELRVENPIGCSGSRVLQRQQSPTRMCRSGCHWPSP